MWNVVFLPFGCWEHTQIDTNLIKRAKISSFGGHEQQSAHGVIQILAPAHLFTLFWISCMALKA